MGKSQKSIKTLNNSNFKKMKLENDRMSTEPSEVGVNTTTKSG